MSSANTEREKRLRQAFEKAKLAMIDRSPPLSLLARDSGLWRRVEDRIVEGYDSGIWDIAELTAYAEMAVPNLRRLHRLDESDVPRRPETQKGPRPPGGERGQEGEGSPKEG